ncbi:MAG: T9SS type A sorting domain-containing protein [Bacteroidia bacterium]|nr:T9SS type A sorting domain-containing protein [Bacteroidia bacterium]
MKKQLSVLCTCLILILTINSKAQVNLDWVKSVGGTGYDQGNAITLDALGNVYTTGFFSDVVDFDPSAAVFTLTSSGSNTDCYITKFDVNGNFIWAKNIGSTDSEYGKALKIDANGDILIAGTFQGTVDFDPNAGINNLTATGGTDMFILRLDANGNFIWAEDIGSSYTDPKSLTIDNNGNILTTGVFSGVNDFDPGAAVFSITGQGNNDIFVLKLTSSGNFVWAKAVGESGFDNGESVTVDATGNCYVTGYFQNTADFDPGAGTYSLTSTGGDEIFIFKLDLSGNFVWAKRIGNTGSDLARSIISDASNNIYLTGFFTGTTDFDPDAGVFNLVAGGPLEAFILKLNSSGNLVWAKCTNSGGSTCEALSIQLDIQGNVYTTGIFQNTTDFDPSTNTSTLTSNGSNDIYILKLDPSGNFLWVRGFGNSNFEAAYSIAVYNTNSVYTTGGYTGTVDFDPNGTVNNQTSIGSQDIFIHKLSELNVGIKPNSSSLSDITVFPNPFNDKLTVQFAPSLQGSHIELYNLLGTLIYTDIITSNQEIDMSKQPKGIYFIRIGMNEKTVTKKIIKE